MKRLSETLNENLAMGNSLNKGVTNHYTPIDNIIINVRNLFGSWLGIVVDKSEDGFGIKLTSNSFSSPEATNHLLYSVSFDGRCSLYDYISLSGLRDIKCLEIGPMNYVVYCCPTDIQAAQSPEEQCKACACKEQLSANVYEAEIVNVLNEDFDGEEELQDTTYEELEKMLNNRNKIEAAKQLSDYFGKTLTLPDNMYIKATKDADGHESVALRMKYEKRRPFGGKVESTVSLLNIYNAGVNAIWVPAFDTQSEIHWEINDTISGIINGILSLVNAQATDDECMFNIGNKPADEEDENNKQPEETPATSETPDATVEVK